MKKPSKPTTPRKPTTKAPQVNPWADLTESLGGPKAKRNDKAKH